MSSRTETICLAAAMVLTLNGCATGQPESVRIENKFLGTWANVNPGYRNWWEFKNDEVINYGADLSDGKCEGSKVIILKSDMIDVRFGNAAEVNLRIIDDQLVFFFVNGRKGPAHKRVLKSDVCRRPDGTYFDGAPAARKKTAGVSAAD